MLFPPVRKDVRKSSQAKRLVILLGGIGGTSGIGGIGGTGGTGGPGGTELQNI